MKSAPNRAVISWRAREATSPNSFQSGAAQAAGDGAVGAEREHRQWFYAIGFFAVADDAAMNMAVHRSRTDRCAGNRGADGKALPRQRAANHLHQFGFAAEQMRATGDVEEQAVRGIQRHQRREAVAPVGDGVQCLRIRGLVGIEYLYVRADRAGIGQRQAHFKPETGRGIVECGNLQRVVLFGDDDAGLVSTQHVVVARQLPLDAVGRQARQPQAEDAPALHGKGTHHISIP